MYIFSIYSIYIYIPFIHGIPPKWNYFWRAGPLQYTGFPLVHCISVPSGIVVRSCVWLQWIFHLFWRKNVGESFNTFALFMIGDLQTHPSRLHWMFSSFWPKTVWPLCPTLPIHLILLSDIFVSPMKRVLKKKRFANVEEVKQKTAEALKDIRIDEFKNCFWTMEKKSW